MRLQPVTGTPFVYICMGCDKRHQTDKTKTFADLDGEAYRAYYCEQCAMNEGAEKLEHTNAIAMQNHGLDR